MNCIVSIDIYCHKFINCQGRQSCSNSRVSSLASRNIMLHLTYQLSKFTSLFVYIVATVIYTIFFVFCLRFQQLHTISGGGVVTSQQGWSGVTNLLLSCTYCGGVGALEYTSKTQICKFA